MKIYCTHSIKVYTKKSNYYQCSLCPAGWYGSDSVPLVVIGDSDPLNIDKRYGQNKEKDLSTKKFRRCDICRDLIEKRKHIICEFKRFLDTITVGPAPEKPKRRLS